MISLGQLLELLLEMVQFVPVHLLLHLCELGHLLVVVGLALARVIRLLTLSEGPQLGLRAVSPAQVRLFIVG